MSRRQTLDVTKLPIYVVKFDDGIVPEQPKPGLHYYYNVDANCGYDRDAFEEHLKTEIVRVLQDCLCCQEIKVPAGLKNVAIEAAPELLKCNAWIDLMPDWTNPIIVRNKVSYIWGQHFINTDGVAKQITGRDLNYGSNTISNQLLQLSQN